MTFEDIHKTTKTDWTTVFNIVINSDAKAFSKTIDELNKMKQQRFNWKVQNDYENDFIQSLLKVRQRNKSFLRKSYESKKTMLSNRSKTTHAIYNIRSKWPCDDVLVVKDSDLINRDNRVLQNRLNGKKRVPHQDLMRPSHILTNLQPLRKDGTIRSPGVSQLSQSCRSLIASERSYKIQVNNEVNLEVRNKHHL